MTQQKTTSPRRNAGQRCLISLMLVGFFYLAGIFFSADFFAQPAIGQTATPATSPSNKTQLAKTSGYVGSNRIPNDEGFADLVAKLSPAVVNIRSLQTEVIKSGDAGVPPELQELFKHFGYTPPDNYDKKGGKPQKRTIAGIGSGFLISKDGLVVTNNHVIQNASEVRVTLSNDRSYVAKVIGRDDRTDVALLKINGTNLPHVTFGNSDKLRVGNWVIAIGNPIGLGGSVSVGIVSALGRNIGAGQYDDFIQTDAAINRGNSGGPLFNIKGEVVGINSIIYSETGGNIGIGFAIPANQAIDVIEQIKRYGSPRRSWLGVALQEVDEDMAQQFGLTNSPRGALIVGVVDKSPAATAGLKIGDIILKIDNQEVKKSQNLPRIVASEKSGKAVNLTIWRNKQIVTKNIVLSLLNRSDDDINKSAMTVFKKIQGGGIVIDNLGFAIRNITDQDRAILYLSSDLPGVLISAFTNDANKNKGDSIANDVMIGTLILSIDGQTASNAELAAAQLKKLILSKKPFPMFIFVPGSGFALVKIDPTQN
ncbi:MAG: Do family serine endopeptidase [Hydrotalea sp.]|nr:Do family serine endopeptidase [Hydrotalea sp.]